MSLFKPEVIASLLANFKARIDALEKKVKEDDKASLLGEYNASQDGGSPGFGSQFQTYLTLVLTPDTDSAAFSCRLVQTTDTTSKWEADTALTGVFTVDVPANLTMPENGDLVTVLWTGVSGNPPKSRYVLIGGGGPTLMPCLVSSVNTDTLSVFFLSEAGSPTGDLTYVAKAHTHRFTPWEGSFGAPSITYSLFEDGVFRQATRSSPTNKTISQQILPPFIQGTSIIYVGPLSFVTTLDGQPCKYMDANTDGRLWARIN